MSAAENQSIASESHHVKARAPFDEANGSAAWQGEELHQVTWFDFEQVDRNLTKEIRGSPDDVKAAAAAALAKIMVWTWGGARGCSSAIVRFASLTAALRPDLIGDKTYKEIGESLGVGKAAISKAALLFQRAFSIQASRSRSAEGRAHMAAAAQGNHNRRGKSCRKGKARPDHA